MLWYKKLKDCFPEKLLDSYNMSRMFAHILDIIYNIAITGKSTFNPTLVPNVQQQQQHTGYIKKKSTQPMLSFKNTVERFAASCDVMFVPTKTTHNGKPVYKFGETEIYLSNNVVFCKVNKDTWSPSSLNDLKKLNQDKMNMDFD